jgi:radical SAM superfamily enzyme YgiQ (UPF0313 family)
MRDEVILTADNTLMSDYHHSEFLGFGACAPSNFIPDLLYEQLFFPAIKTIEGKPFAAPYGLRKIESQLVKEGLKVSIVAPDHLGPSLKRAKVLGIHVMDPFGLGPASSTFAAVMKREPFLARHFRKLLNSRKIQKAKSEGLKVVVGGPGTWQMHFRPNFVKKYGIDCVIEGEAENVVGKLFRAAVAGESLPAFYQTSVEETPTVDEIPEIVGPSINGLVEIGRGCCRGCSFCSVTLRPLRWFPIEKILKEVDVNLKAGVGKVTLHQDDVMLYGSRNTLPNDEKLVNLSEAVSEKCENISWSHASIAAVAAKPKLFAQVAEIIRQKQSWWGAEIGLETGSPELAKRIMPAKAHPFKPDDWPEVVRSGMALMHDNMLVPACTLIVGAPEETEDDVIKTIELMDDLKGFRSLIVPLFFVPMGRFKDENWFQKTQMKGPHYELLTKCVQHDFYWLGDLIRMRSSEGWQERVLNPLYKLFISITKLKMKQSGMDVELEKT